MIEPTVEMVTTAAEVAEDEMIRCLGRDLGTIHRNDIIRAILAAAFTIVERDYDVSPKLPPVEHKQRREIWWNHYSERYEAECVCGESFLDVTEPAAEDRLLDHIEGEARQ